MGYLFIISFFYSLALQLRGLKWILIGCFIKLSVQTFQPLILIYRSGNFVYYYWGCISIYRPLNYPLRSLSSYLFCFELFLLKASLQFCRNCSCYPGYPWVRRAEYITCATTKYSKRWRWGDQGCFRTPKNHPDNPNHSGTVAIIFWVRLYAFANNLK